MAKDHEKKNRAEESVIQYVQLEERVSVCTRDSRVRHAPLACHAKVEPTDLCRTSYPVRDICKFAVFTPGGGFNGPIK